MRPRHRSSRPRIPDDDGPFSEDHGKIREVKNLYRTKKDENGNTSWTTEMPTTTPEIAENSETAKYALLIRNEKCYDGRRPFNIHSIVIQSAVLKSILEDVLHDYRGVTINVRRLEFQAPWHCFVHRWNKLVDIKNELCAAADQAEDDEVAQEKRDCIVLLHDTLKEELRDTVNTRDDLMREGVMTYDLLWTLFEPGSVVVSEQHGSKVQSSALLPIGYQVRSQFIDWDGQNFGYAPKITIIPPFTGTHPIQSLPIYPLTCCNNVDGFKRDVVARARKWENLCGFRYQRYDGVAEISSPFGRSKYTVHGRIVIDTENWKNFNPNEAPMLGAMEVNAEFGTMPTDSDLDISSDEWETDIHAISSPDKGRSSKHPLSQDQLLLTTSTLRGYSCKDKRWMYFETENVSDIIWDDHAFDDLVLPAKHKELVRSVAESQAVHSDYFDDIIQGKGQGMVILLNGPPGVGKTLTAESVAEVMKVPLYYMSTVDLGCDAASIESALTKVFNMVTRWRAVLLLDEADVFLERRTSHDLERNKLVSVFLRVLEYYCGLLFLTTNRGDCIDDAFQSRIHLRLVYGALTVESRCKIWMNFVKTLNYKQNFTDKDFNDLAKIDLNGRQIKNLLKTAVLLAVRNNEALQKSHVEYILEIDPQA